MRFLQDIKDTIHEADMKTVLKAVLYVSGATNSKAEKVAKALADTLARYENEDCWKDIIVYSPIAGEVCDVIENRVV
jgi:hypothetical protein